MNYYLAIDIGASSGRHILGSLENGQLNLEEIYRFENGMKKKEGHLVWDTKYLFHEILEGIKKCKEINKIPKSIAIDTWAVDYVLLDENDEVIGDVYGYRDSRTKGMDEEVYKHITPERLYRFSGIQKQSFNTIHQLMADKIQRPKELDKAKTFLMLPDYFQFLLTGKKKSEYTNATSTQLVKVNTRKWNRKLMADLGIPKDMFLRLNEPGEAFEKETHCVDLTQSTIEANKRFFEKEEDVPRQAYTMGIKSIMQAKKILVVVSGEDKADIVAKAFAGPVTPEVPASVLQLHNDVTLVGDKAALSKFLKITGR